MPTHPPPSPGWQRLNVEIPVSFRPGWIVRGEAERGRAASGGGAGSPQCTATHLHGRKHHNGLTVWRLSQQSGHRNHNPETFHKVCENECWIFIIIIIITSSILSTLPSSLYHHRRHRHPHHYHRHHYECEFFFFIVSPDRQMLPDFLPPNWNSDSFDPIKKKWNKEKTKCGEFLVLVVHSGSEDRQEKWRKTKQMLTSKSAALMLLKSMSLFPFCPRHWFWPWVWSWAWSWSSPWCRSWCAVALCWVALWGCWSADVGCLKVEGDSSYLTLPSVGSSLSGHW